MLEELFSLDNMVYKARDVKESKSGGVLDPWAVFFSVNLPSLLPPSLAILEGPIISGFCL